MLIILFEGINKTTFYQLDYKFNSKGVLFMNKVIKVIHPIKGKLEGDVYTPKPKKKVAAYARVSTNYQDQINSYIVQCDEYTKMIQSNPDYIFLCH